MHRTTPPPLLSTPTISFLPLDVGLLGCVDATGGCPCGCSSSSCASLSPPQAEAAQLSLTFLPRCASFPFAFASTPSSSPSSSSSSPPPPLLGVLNPQPPHSRHLDRKAKEQPQRLEERSSATPADGGCQLTLRSPGAGLCAVAASPPSPSAGSAVVELDWLTDVGVGVGDDGAELSCPLYLHSGDELSEVWTSSGGSGDADVGLLWSGASDSSGAVGGVSSGSDGGDACDASEVPPSSPSSSSPSSSSYSFASLPLSPVSDCSSDEAEQQRRPSSSAGSAASPTLGCSPRSSPHDGVRAGDAVVAGAAAAIGRRRVGPGKSSAAQQPQPQPPLRSRKRRLTASSPDARGRQSPSASPGAPSSSPLWRAASDPPPPARGWGASTSPSSSFFPAPSSPTPLSPVLDEEDKRERNKQSASDYRKRRKMYVTSLEQRLQDASAQLQEAQSSMKKLTAENQVLRQSMQVLSTLVHQRSNTPTAAASLGNGRGTDSTVASLLALPSSSPLLGPLVPPPYRPVAPSLQADCAISAFSASEAAEEAGPIGARPLRSSLKPATADSSRSRRAGPSGAAKAETRQRQRRMGGSLMAVLFSCFLLYLPWLMHMDDTTPASFFPASQLPSSLQASWWLSSSSPSLSSSPSHLHSALPSPDCALQPWSCHAGRTLLAVRTRGTAVDAVDPHGEARENKLSLGEDDPLHRLGEEDWTSLGLARWMEGAAKGESGAAPLCNSTTTSFVGLSSASNATSGGHITPHQPTKDSTASLTFSVLSPQTLSTASRGDVNGSQGRRRATITAMAYAG